MDPHKIPPADLPLIVFSDCTSGLIEFIIKFRTKGAYNHVMWMHKPGLLASQGNTYSEAPFARYMKKNSRLKFVEVIGLTEQDRSAIQKSIALKLARPWWKKRYDWLGIIGQAIGITWINTPWLDYCSEDAPQHLKTWAEKWLDPSDPRSIAMLAIPRHASPQQLSDYFQNKPEFFRLYGKWEDDD